MSELQQDQAAIDIALVRALTRCIPREWDKAAVRAVRASAPAGESAHRITITGPEEHGSVVAPSEDLMLQIRRLELLFEQHGTPWREVVYSATRADDGSWGFMASFAY